jgi:hypothetical protein
MVRRLILLAAASAALGVATLGGPALAQEPNYPIDIPTTTTTVAPTTSTSVSPTTIERETTTTEAAVVPPETTSTVAGVVIPRPLPRTGNDFGLQVIIGAGLTAAGLAFATTARLRRQRASHAPL